MAVTHRTLAILDAIRLDLDRRISTEDRLIVEAWARAWAELRPAWSAAIDRLILIQQQGRKPTRREVSEALRATKAIVATQDAIIALAREQGIRISATLPDLTKAARRLEAEMLASTLPPNIPPGHALAGVTFDRVDPKALDAIVRRTARQVTALTWPLSREATAAMKSILIRGVALGMHPNAAAALMLDRVGLAFNGGLARAVVIARTEMLDAHRAATAAQDKANRDLLTGWQWVASLPSRTCPSCWAMHGTEHDLDEPGPIDHQQGRCARVPLTKSWRELGLRHRRAGECRAGRADHFPRHAACRPARGARQGPPRPARLRRDPLVRPRDPPQHRRLAGLDGAYPGRRSSRPSCTPGLIPRRSSPPATETAPHRWHS
jgi:SPP1 gp7 family putative phage head morphogenesis protein